MLSKTTWAVTDKLVTRSIAVSESLENNIPDLAWHRFPQKEFKSCQDPIATLRKRPEVDDFRYAYAIVFHDEEWRIERGECKSLMPQADHHLKSHDMHVSFVDTDLCSGYLYVMYVMYVWMCVHMCVIHHMIHISYFKAEQNVGCIREILLLAAAC